MNLDQKSNPTIWI